MVIIVCFYASPSYSASLKAHQHYFSTKSIHGAFDNRSITEHGFYLFAALEAVKAYFATLKQMQNVSQFYRHINTTYVQVCTLTSNGVNPKAAIPELG